MFDQLKVYAATFAGFLAVDLVWLALTARGFYKKHLGYLMADTPVWWAALAFYFLFIAGLQVFVIQPALQSGSWTSVLLRGALFGLVTYGTYDLTNLATIKDWPWFVSLVDMVWGAFLAAAAAGSGFAVGRWIGLR